MIYGSEVKDANVSIREKSGAVMDTKNRRTERKRHREMDGARRTESGI